MFGKDDRLWNNVVGPPLAGWLAVAASGLRHCSGFCQERQNSDNTGTWGKNRKLVGVRSS
jgi:hypothetical protein